LALQVAGQIDLLGKHKGIRALPIYGGCGYGDQIAELRRGVKVVVGTPGRLVDHLEKGTLNLSGLNTLILDEADEMISMGFKENLEQIIEASPRDNGNIWLFSATMSPEVRRVADTYLREPKRVQLNRSEVIPKSLEQLYYPTKESNKPDILCKLVDGADDFFGLVFCQTKTLVTDLTDYMLARGYRADCLHGDKSQADRERAMTAFRERRVNVLICTDVASRGLDVKDVTHVINYSIPRELENYVHRIGRTARSGKTGYAMSLVTPSHRYLIEKIERATNSQMVEGRLPTRKEIGRRKATRFLGDFLAQQETHTRAAELLDEGWRAVIDAMDKDEIVGRFIAMSLPHLFAEPAQAPASLAPKKQQEGGREKRFRDRDDRGDYPRDREFRGDRSERRRDRTYPSAPNGTRIEIAAGSGRPMISSRPDRAKGKGVAPQKRGGPAPRRFNDAPAAAAKAKVGKRFPTVKA
jgi:ATP-dependent RNA helicase DeaD